MESNKPAITFNIELRPATLEQTEAGKRLFSNLLERAQSQDLIENKTRTKRVNSARVDGGSRHPLNPPSLTNRGD